MCVHFGSLEMSLIFCQKAEGGFKFQPHTLTKASITPWVHPRTPLQIVVLKQVSPYGFTHQTPLQIVDTS